MLAMTSILLLGLVTSSLEAAIYLFYNGHVSDDFNLTASNEEITKPSSKVEVIANMAIIE
jgi:hypothetical protein